MAATGGETSPRKRTCSPGAHPILWWLWLDSPHITNGTHLFCAATDGQQLQQRSKVPSGSADIGRANKRFTRSHSPCIDRYYCHIHSIQAHTDYSLLSYTRQGILSFIQRLSCCHDMVLQSITLCGRSVHQLMDISINLMSNQTITTPFLFGACSG